MRPGRRHHADAIGRIVWLRSERVLRSDPRVGVSVGDRPRRRRRDCRGGRGGTGSTRRPTRGHRTKHLLLALRSVQGWSNFLVHEPPSPRSERGGNCRRAIQCSSAVLLAGPGRDAVSNHCRFRAKCRCKGNSSTRRRASRRSLSGFRCGVARPHDVPSLALTWDPSIRGGTARGPPPARSSPRRSNARTRIRWISVRV